MKQPNSSILFTRAGGSLSNAEPYALPVSAKITRHGVGTMRRHAVLLDCGGIDAALAGATIRSKRCRAPLATALQEPEFPRSGSWVGSTMQPLRSEALNLESRRLAGEHAGAPSGSWSAQVARLAWLLGLAFVVPMPAQTVNDLVANYTGTATWNAGSGTMTFVTTGEIAFNAGFGRTTNDASRWDVPSGVARITIASNVTVTGQFKFNNSGTYVVAGQNRYTSRIYGTPEQKFTQNRGLSAVDFSAILTANNTVTVSNLTSFDPKGYHLRGPSGGKIHASECDFLDTRGGRQNNSDGYVGGGGSVVRDCFFETGDDIFKVYWGTTTYEDNIVRMVPNTVPIQFGWGDYGSGAVGNFHNLIVLGSEGRGSERMIIDGSTGSYTKTLNIGTCDIQNLTSTLIRLNNSGQNATVTIGDAWIQVNKFSTVASGSTLTADICGGAPPASSYDCRGVVPAIPTAPGSFTVVGIGTAIQLNWADLSGNESMFRIERATSAGGPWTERGFLIHNKTSWTDSFVETGPTCYYRMRAYNTTGYSAYTPVKSATTAPPIVPPEAPFDLVATALAPNQIQLSWSDGSVNETAFEIQRATNSGGPWGFLGSSASNVTSLADSTVMANTTYHYQVRATNSAGMSAWSDPAQTTTPPAGSGGGYTNLDVAMSATNWNPATNPAPPSLGAVINFSTATNLTWEWDDSSGTNATLTYTIARADTSGPGGAEVYFFGSARFTGVAANLHLAVDVAKSPNNIGTLRFALRQGTNLFYTSSGLNNVPGTVGPIVTCELTGLMSVTLRTNGVISQEGMTWTSVYSGASPDFTNGPPLEFGVRSDAALGAAATSSMRGPVLDNYRVEITGLPTPTNQPPVLAAISNQTIGAGAVLSVTNSAADPDLPPQMLTFSLLTSPAGAVVDPNSGVIHWRPTIAQGGGVYPLTVTVLDDGVPRLGATQSFDVTVTPAAVPTISGVGWGGGRFEMTVGGSAGPDYTVWASTNLLDWAVVFITNSPAVPFQWNDPDSILHPRRFYRVGIGP